jgi:hypothetical protein
MDKWGVAGNTFKNFESRPYLLRNELSNHRVRIWREATVTELAKPFAISQACARDCCQEAMRYNVVVDTPAFYVAPLSFAARSSAKFCPNHFHMERCDSALV